MENQMINFISQYIVLDGSPLTEDEITFLYHFVNQYNRFRDLAYSYENRSDSRYGRGFERFTRWDEWSFYFGQDGFSPRRA